MLTLIVSLEAIFLSTFVVIGQNRQTSLQRAQADHDYATVDKLLEENTALTRPVHDLTAELPGTSSAARRAASAPGHGDPEYFVLTAHGAGGVPS